MVDDDDGRRGSPTTVVDLRGVTPKERTTEVIWFLKYENYMHVLYDWHGSRLASCFTRADAMAAAEDIAADRGLQFRIAESGESE